MAKQRAYGGKIIVCILCPNGDRKITRIKVSDLGRKYEIINHTRYIPVVIKIR